MKIKPKVGKAFYISSLFIGFAFLLVGVKVYEDTFIDLRGLVLSALVLSLFYWFIIINHYNSTYGISNMIYSFFQSFISVGCSFMALFLLLNSYGASQVTFTKNYPVIQHGKNGGKQSYAVIRFNEFNKSIQFKKRTQIQKNDLVRLELSKGLFNFYVIKNKIIMKR